MLRGSFAGLVTALHQKSFPHSYLGSVHISAYMHSSSNTEYYDYKQNNYHSLPLVLMMVQIAPYMREAPVSFYACEHYPY